MQANLKVFGNMDYNRANDELESNIDIIKKEAAALCHHMTLVHSRIEFDSKEEEKRWTSAKEAIQSIKDFEVTSQIEQNELI